jgi:predicted nucleic acid-binding protein
VKLADIPNQTAVLVDANVLVYHFAPDPILGPACQQFLDRVDRQEITAFTTTHILSDVTHRLMTLEAITRFGWPPAGIAQRLRNHPSELKQLTNYRLALVEIHNSRVQILPTSVAILVAAADMSRQYGLLSGDALVVAVMQGHALSSLASHDVDFDRVPGITRYAPA